MITVADYFVEKLNGM